ncbi:MAG: ATP-binding protein [Anaerolineae bacterium]|jgi:NtrC-family two-component system sensor histidine kinase KinB
MNRQHLFYIYIATSIIILSVLLWLTFATPLDPSQLLAALLFGVLIVFTDTFGVRLPSGMVSLLPMTTVASYLVVGLVPTGWATLVGTLIYGLFRLRWAKPLELPRIENGKAFTTILTANITIHTASILIGGVVFQLAGGETPLEFTSLSQLLPLILLGLTYLTVNHLTISPAIATHSRKALQTYLRSLPNLLFYEGGPLIFAPLVALIYLQLGVVQFVLFALFVIIASLVTRSLAITSGRLERRVKELDSLQAVGQALSASLNLDTILKAIHTQVAALMPARNFYVALYDPETNEVSFPLAFEDGKRVYWRSRPMGKGLTEHIMTTRKPLLIRRDVGATLKKIDIEQIGQLAASWLGAPILAEGEPIGVIAIQSYSTPEAYDLSHQEILVTIAAQAAVAIQNARLYERTDEALARRVQELNSILRTTGEGILLLDTRWRVLAANRALSGFLGVAQTEIIGQVLDTSRSEGEPLVILIGYTPEALRAACEELAQDDTSYKQTIAIPGPPERYVERTLTPVRDREGATVGWLFIFRDMTEEMELARLREDLTHMLVHDLRSPLTVLNGSLEMLESVITSDDTDSIESLLQMAKRGTDRLLRMVNELLDISKLESGQLILRPENVRAESMLKDIAARLNALAEICNITLEISITPDLPQLCVDIEFISRVLHNLLDNAIKFTPDDGLIRLWARPGPDHDPATLLVGVTDSGPGIPPEEQHRVFEKFQQTSVTGRRVGTGLGLPFCKLAVEAHGGEIWVESEVGEGSSFIMRLPAAKPET